MLLKLIPKKIKVWLLERLYKDIAAEGRMGDTQLAHINDYEAGLLKSVLLLLNKIPLILLIFLNTLSLFMKSY